MIQKRYLLKKGNLYYCFKNGNPVLFSTESIAKIATYEIGGVVEARYIVILNEKILRKDGMILLFEKEVEASLLDYIMED